MTRFPNRKQIARLIVKSGESISHSVRYIDGLQKMPIGDCRIVHL